jgi:hypothetical protein
MPVKGIEWGGSRNPFPVTILGSLIWNDYEVSSDVYIEKAGYAAVYGRIKTIIRNRNLNPPEGYCLKVDQGGNWELKAAGKTLAWGKTGFSADSWHTLKLAFKGTKIAAFIDNVNVCSTYDITYVRGMAGVGCGWHNARFDNFMIGGIE